MTISCFYGLTVKTFYGTRTFLVSAYVVIAIPTILLNLAVLVAIWKIPSLHKPSQVLIANLALVDLFVGTVADTSATVSNLAIINEWNNFYCHCWIFLGTFAFLLGAVSLHTLAVISIDRFLAVKLMLNYRTVVTIRRAVYLASAGWLINGSLYAIAIVLLFKNIPLSEFVLAVTLYIVILLCSITTFYSMAFYHLKRVSSQVSSNNTNEPAAPNVSPNFNVTKYRRSLYTMLIVLLAVFIFYLPYLCFAILESIFKEDAMMGHLTRVGEFWLGINSFVNPILYLWRMRDLREAVKDTVKRLLKLA